MMNVNHINLKQTTGLFVFVITVIIEVINIMEDEERAIFDCPGCNTCRLNNLKMFNHAENNLRVFI